MAEQVWFQKSTSTGDTSDSDIPGGPGPPDDFGPPTTQEVIMTAQVWFHQNMVTGNTSDSPLVSEPPVGYISQAISSSAVDVEIPSNAKIAVIETDVAVAYRVRPSTGDPAAVLADDPIIPITTNSRYVIDVSKGGNISFITA